MSAPFTEPMAEQLLDTEVFPTRLEHLATDLFTKIDKVDYLPTSRTYDLGRDARTRGHAFIACGVEKKYEAKATSDLERILKFTEVKRYIFCTTQKLSDHQIEALVKKLTVICPTMDTVEVHGLTQLARLSHSHHECFTKHYLAELENLRNALLTTTDEGFSAQMVGMRLALTMQLTDDAAQLKRQLLQELILLALSNGLTATVDGISQKVSQLLHLPGALNTAFLTAEVTALTADQKLEVIGQAYKISDRGRASLASQAETGRRNLLEGRNLFQQAFDELAKASLSADEFNQIWRVVESGLAELFLKHGLNVVTAVGAVINGQSEVSEHPDLNTGILEIGNRIEALNLRSPDLSSAIGQAFIDALHEKSTRLFEWLTHLAAVYVSACSLGLDANAQQQVRTRIGELDLFLDTDIVLSLLGDAEANHKAVVELIKNWRKVGGGVFVTTNVLEEVAYHAWISKREVDESWNDILKYSDIEAERLLGTVFIRSYRRMANGKMNLRGWNQYIANFAGGSMYDHSNVRKSLMEERVEVVSDEGIDEVLAEKVKQQLIALKSRTIPASAVNKLVHVADKSRRDGRLVALLCAHRKKKAEIGRSAVIMSSSGSLDAVCSKQSDAAGPVPAVMSAAGLAVLLSLLPGVAMSGRTLKQLLFDTGFSERVDFLERRVLKIIKASTEYDMPFARRHVLRSEVQKGLAKLAANSGERIEAFEEHFAKADNPAFMALVADSVDKFATSRAELENRKLLDEVERLKMELEKVRNDNQRKEQRRKGRRGD